MKTKAIADFLGCEIIGDGDIDIIGVAALDHARENEIAFFEKADGNARSNASCIIVPLDLSIDTDAVLIRSTKPKLDFSRIAQLLHPQKAPAPGIHSSAVIGNNTSIDEGVFLGPLVTIGDNSAIGSGTQIWAGSRIGGDVVIGKNCVIHQNVVIEDGSKIGNGVILHAGVVIGGDGFGYVADKDGEHLKFPQIGTLVIEDNVEIGANSCVDRGSLGETRIGSGTKIDNLVQIAHNVQIGRRVIIAAQSGIAGSSTIEDDVVIAGQVGIADHVLIKAGSVIGAKSAVFPNKIIRRGIWSGIPVQPLDEYKRKNALVGSIERVARSVREIKKKLD